MEFPDLGKNCSYKDCNQLDFLPVKCDACGKVFCQNHMKYEQHGCIEGASKNFQIPVCPLCNEPVLSSRGEQPDIAVGAHIDNDCQSGTAIGRRKVYTNKCSMKGCKRREMVPVQCKDCELNYCIVHRHPSDHNCNERKQSNQMTSTNIRQLTTVSPVRPCHIQDIQGNMSEDEALARALQLSLNEAEENLDRVTPGQIARSISQSPSTAPHTPSNHGSSNCNVS